MTVQKNDLAPPKVKNVKEGVLSVSQIVGSVSITVEPIADAIEGDKLAFIVKTSTGDSIVYSVTIERPSDAYGYGAEKNFFEKGLAEGASVEVQYTVTRDGGVRHSPKVKFRLVQ
ncbi:hypothetical protein HP062_25605 [Pseudomonas sp. B14-6]|jgi:hypothetical protein|uniref:Uncharacterized protein n=1 Tax=Pseudomonas fluorescens TaxID=294 RepID=A0A5E7HZJ9_PSEFL|nr:MULTISPECIES: hypothetical protein [Pseudomonas]MDF9883080.1 hypothetical protein [Pseudomonas silensiensis]QKG68701.1 hypothetical protein HP062_25605 [Pseudomonas sp. B14-6]QQN99810.1 hypothetical protein JIO00_04530 [Pseudomonas sp. SW-3]VVO69478.1 hypothetical protein PS870_01213 [Pseudomonas fluorescens]